MNKDIMLDWLLRDTEQKGNDHYKQKHKLETTLDKLNNGRGIALPVSLPTTPKKMLPILRQHFKNNVTFISLVLHHHFPEQYLFYRVSKLEKEIFEGFEFFSEIVPEFKFRFSNIGKNGIDRYLELNEALLSFAHQHWSTSRTYWSKTKNPHRKLMYFLYNGLGKLFLDKNNYRHYWVVATQEQYFDALDSKETVVTWSGRKEMQLGDQVFVYRTAPRKAITDILRVKDEPSFDPWGAWDGFWVNLEKVREIKDIPFADMKQDPVISQWGTVRKNFQGTVTEPIPHLIYNELLKKIPKTIRTKSGLKPEPIGMDSVISMDLPQPTMATPQCSGKFTLEEEFEDEVIAPLLKQWGFKYKRQHPCPFRIGSQDHCGGVDFYVSDEKGAVTLFENKLQIRKDKDLDLAMKQARSYALLLGFPSFVVASPEGLWLYSLNKDKEQLVKSISIEDMTSQNQEDEFKNLVLRLRQ